MYNECESDGGKVNCSVRRICFNFNFDLNITSFAIHHRRNLFEFFTKMKTEERNHITRLAQYLHGNDYSVNFVI